MDHVCDGWHQCPERDDELLCHLQCPPQCVCQGLAFVCRSRLTHVHNTHITPLTHIDNSHIRYLDAAGSGTQPQVLVNNVYLIHLTLSRCKINQWPLLQLQNLQYLDLAQNFISILNMTKFAPLTNLKHLILYMNPLTTLYDEDQEVMLMNLKSIDLSFTSMSSFGVRSFPRLTSLNLSHSNFNDLQTSEFDGVPLLQKLDLRGNDIQTFSAFVFRRLTRLTHLYSDNFKLCCRQSLPENFNTEYCFAPSNAVSSCEDLLRSNVYRLCLWIFVVLSVLGNIFSLVYKIKCEKRDTLKLGFHLFVLSLSLSDLLMGVYLMFVGVADVSYRGRYLWWEESWRGSGYCSLAGVLGFVSCEVSAFMICLITLDRFVVLRFPFSTVRFATRSVFNKLSPRQ